MAFKNKNWVLKLLVAVTLVISILIVATGPDFNDLGLKFFQKIKGFRGKAVDLEKLKPSYETIVSHLTWDELLKDHVDASGLVDYDGFRKDSLEFYQYLDSLSKYPPAMDDLSPVALAYWINAYNAFTIKLIIDHYPVNSIKDIGGEVPMINSPWDIKFFVIGGVDFDLNTIEHEILRKQFKEPRIHFVINCASISCPPMKREAFVAEKLEVQLEEQARIFINDTTRNLISDSEVKISKIFDWFKSDFTTSSSLHEYISKYSVFAINPDSRIDYMDYNWELNEAKE